MKFDGIMKLQLPVVASKEAAFGVGYDRARRLWVQFDPALLAGRMGKHFPETHKGFFHCTIDDDNQLTIGAIAPWQEW